MGATCCTMNTTLQAAAREMKGIREDLEPSIQNIDELLVSVRVLQGEVGKVAILQAQVQALEEEVKRLREIAIVSKEAQLNEVILDEADDTKPVDSTG